MVVLDLTHDLPAVEEAYERNIMTISLVNAHSDLSRITYPIYAGALGMEHFHTAVSTLSLLKMLLAT